MVEVIISTIAIVVSVISIIVSAIAAHVANKQNLRLNRINMKARYYEKIFDEYLIRKIPQARKYLRFDKNRLVDSQQLSDVLSTLLNDSLYFKYDDKEFYQKLRHMIQEIEDYVLECGNRTYEQEDQAEVYIEIQRKLEKLYRYINDNYTGNE